MRAVAIASPVLLVSLTALAAGAEIPPRSASGLTLEVPAGEVGGGQAWYLLEGDTQISVRSQAELQSATLTSGRAVGYLVGPLVEDAVEEGLERPIAAGALRIPAHSLRSGVAATDALFHGEALLSVAAHPEITVRFVSLSGLEALPVPEEQAGEQVRARGRASLEVGFRGVERPLEVLVEMSFRLSSNAAMSRMVGDLATVSSSFELKLADWGVEVPPPLAPLVAPSVGVDVFLTFCNVNPDGFVFLVPEDQHLAENRIRTLLRDERRTVEGWSRARAYLTAHWDDAAVLSRVALDLLGLEDVERRDFALLAEAAGRAEELTGGRDAAALATHARVRFELGEVARAVELQRRAVRILDEAGDGGAEAARGRLADYEAAVPQG